MDIKTKTKPLERFAQFVKPSNQVKCTPKVQQVGFGMCKKHKAELEAMLK